MKTSERRRAAETRILLRKRIENLAQRLGERRVLRTLALFLVGLAVIAVLMLVVIG